MALRTEVLVFGCREDDLAVLRSVAGPSGATLLAVDSPAELTEHAIRRRPAAVILGVGGQTPDRLDLIPVLRATRDTLPVIVVAEEDSLELERSTRQRSIFYYLVHPVDRAEVEAVLRDALRAGRQRPGGRSVP
jgi:DNA-binding NtrC family response regulator